MAIRKAKEPIRLRQKKLTNGNISLYLDIYRDGKRRYEFLKLYLIPERAKDDRETNKNTLLLANSIKAKRIVELQNVAFGFEQPTKTNTLFFEYYRELCARKENKSGSWTSCLHHLMRYETNDRITFQYITREWIEGFRNYLQKEANAYDKHSEKLMHKRRLSKNTMAIYFNMLKACIYNAIEDRIILDNPLRGVEGFKTEDGTRMYLTIDEVRLLAQTECDHPIIKAAFLFSCLTGLRRSDIEKLRWGDVYQQGNFTRIIFRQKKTDGQEYLDITSQAADLMGQSGQSDDFVFRDLLHPSNTNKIVQAWVDMAGIRKKITFHCARHTFATMMLDLDTDIYTVSKLLGHRNIATTQIYAKVLDKNKQKAISNIPNILGDKE